MMLRRESPAFIYFALESISLPFNLCISHMMPLYVRRKRSVSPAC